MRRGGIHELMTSSLFLPPPSLITRGSYLTCFDLRYLMHAS